MIKWSFFCPACTKTTNTYGIENLSLREPPKTGLRQHKADQQGDQTEHEKHQNTIGPS